MAQQQRLAQKLLINDQRRYIRQLDIKQEQKHNKKQKIKKQPEKSESVLEFQEDMQEFNTILEKINNGVNHEKTLEDRIDQLLDNQKDSDLLVNILSTLVDQGGDEVSPEFLAGISNVRDIDRILRDQLKSDIIDTEDLGLIHMYLHKFCGEPSTFEYAMLRAYDNIPKLSLFDIGQALTNLQFIEDLKNQQKVMKKVENHLILTHETLMRKKNFQGVISLIQVFFVYDAGSIDLWKKLESLLEQQFSKQNQAAKKEIIFLLIKVLAKKKISNPKIWQMLMRDLSQAMQMSHVTLKEVAKVIKSLYSIEFINPELFEQLVEYLVQRGYDHDDYASMGLSKGVTLINNTIMCNPDLKNKHFIVHAVTFVKQNINDFSRIQLARLVDCFKVHYELKKEEDLLNSLEERLVAKRDEKDNKIKRKQESPNKEESSEFGEADSDVDSDDIGEEDFEIMNK